MHTVSIQTLALEQPLFPWDLVCGVDSPAAAYLFSLLQTLADLPETLASHQPALQ
jgi:hypothetical protein